MTYAMRCQWAKQTGGTRMFLPKFQVPRFGNQSVQFGRYQAAYIETKSEFRDPRPFLETPS